MRKILLFILGTLFLISLISATSVGTSDMTKGKVVYTPPVFINYSIIATNSSNYWGDHFYTDYDLLVPYTGADKTVDLGSENFTTTGTGEFSRLGVGIAPDEDRKVYVSMGASDLYGVYIEGEITPYDGSDYSHALRARRTWDYGTGNILQDMSMNYFVTLFNSSNAKLGEDRTLISQSNELFINRNVSNELAGDRIFWLFPFALTTNNNAVYDSAGAGKIDVANRGVYSAINDYSTFIDTSGTGNINGDKNSAFYAKIISNPVLNSGNLVTTNAGLGVNIITAPVDNSAGWVASINYGVNIETVTGATTNWGIYDGSGANWALDANSQKIFFGETQNASIYFDGNNFIINPQEAGSGNVKILGDANITGNTIFGGNVTVGGGGIFKGATLGDEALGYENIRFGVYAHTPRIIFDNGSMIAQIDYVGDTLRFIFNETGVGNRVTMRINNSGVKIGEAGRRRNLWLYGDLIGVNPAGGGANIKMDGSLNVTGNITGNQYYGEMWYHNHTATELNFAVDGVFYNLTFSESSTNGFIFNDAGDYLESQIAGKYLVNYMASGDGQNNHIYFTSVLVNGVTQDNLESHKKMTAGGDIVTMTGNGFIDLNVGDEVKLATADVGDIGTGNYYSANLNLVRIG